jgi:hypothetical protein
MFYIHYNKIKTLKETFYQKTVTFAPKIDVSLKKTNKTQKNRFEVGFLGGFLGFIGEVCLGGFFIANPD